MIPTTLTGRALSAPGLLFCVLMTGLAPAALHAQELDVPYVPTPEMVVDKMLEAAQVEPGDYVIDLGSGDGRIVIAAAKLGATGHGIDLDPARVREARQNARLQGVNNQTLFLQQDIFEADISQASVVTMYLLSTVNRKLRPRLFQMLRPGTRVVSHSFSMGDWRADETYRVRRPSGSQHTVYLWIMPADASGQWRWRVDGRAFELAVRQTYQEIDVELRAAGSELPTYDVILRGRRISFATREGERRYVFNGRIEGDAISGLVQVREDDERLLPWSAGRD